jgi:hypothetical protein
MTESAERMTTVNDCGIGLAIPDEQIRTSQWLRLVALKAGFFVQEAGSVSLFSIG